MKERFIIFIISLIALIALAVGLLIDESKVHRVIERERAANYMVMGNSAHHAEMRAERWYRFFFVDTKMTEFSFGIAQNEMPASTGDTTVDAVNRATAQGMTWWEGRMRVLWSITYQFFVRLSNIVVWLPLAFMIWLPFLIDAMVVRQIMRTNYALTSPHMQIFGIRAMWWIFLGFALLQLVPFMLHPIWTPVAIAMLCLSSWIGITQFAKRA